MSHGHPWGGWSVLPGGQWTSTACRRWTCLDDLHDASLMACSTMKIDPLYPTVIRGWPYHRNPQRAEVGKRCYERKLGGENKLHAQGASVCRG